MKHLFWAIDCKTAGCETQMFLKYIGVYDPTKMPILVDMDPNPFKVCCNVCGEIHDYADYEIVSRISDAPPPSGFRDQF